MLIVVYPIPALKIDNWIFLFDNNSNIDQVISTFKPPIFWKEKDIVKKQAQSWSTAEAATSRTDSIEDIAADTRTNRNSVLRNGPKILVVPNKYGTT